MATSFPQDGISALVGGGRGIHLRATTNGVASKTLLPRARTCCAAAPRARIAASALPRITAPGSRRAMSLSKSGAGYVAASVFPWSHHLAGVFSPIWKTRKGGDERGGRTSLPFCIYFSASPSARAEEAAGRDAGVARRTKRAAQRQTSRWRKGMTGAILRSVT